MEPTEKGRYEVGVMHAGLNPGEPDFALDPVCYRSLAVARKRTEGTPIYQQRPWIYDREERVFLMLAGVMKEGKP